MAEKTIQSRIQLKYDTLANWEAIAGTFVPKKGETCYVEVPAASGRVASEPALLYKVGDGSSTFSALPWGSALAADVYTWAKQAVKPTYDAVEIVNLDEYIAGTIKDTNTTYKVEQDEDNARELHFFSKEIGADDWTQDYVIIIPDYDDTAVGDRLTTLEGLVGTTSVATQILAAIEALDLANTYEPIGTGLIEATKVQDNLDAYQLTNDAAVEDAQTAADAAQATADLKVASLTAADLSVVVAGTSTAPTVRARVSADADNALSVAADGLKVVVPEDVDYTVTVVESTNNPDYAKTYTFGQTASGLSAVINIPKDMVVQSGSVVTDPVGQPPGTYLQLILANATEDVIYINVDDLIEYVTSGSVAGDQIMVAISSDYKVTATLSNGSVTRAQLVAEVQTSLGKADTAVQANKVITGTANGTISVQGNNVSVAGLKSAAYKDTTAFDAAGSAAAAKLEVVGTSADVATANTVYGAKAHADDALEALTDELADIATTGNVNDLAQTGGDVLILNCGSATVNM